jgi:hypothetical protein
MSTKSSHRSIRSLSTALRTALLLLSALPVVSSSMIPDIPSSGAHPADIRRRSGSAARGVHWGPPSKRAASTVPLVVSNQCGETIWPGIGTQAGTGPGTGGFELASMSSKTMSVSGDWQGRVWGRTNCTFNVGGTGPSNLNGNNGNGAACVTGDCAGVLNCVNTVSLNSQDNLIWH